MEQSLQPARQKDAPTRQKESPGGTPMGPIAIGFVALYLILVAAVVIHGLTVLWPDRLDGADLAGRLARLEEAVGRLAPAEGTDTGSDASGQQAGEVGEEQAPERPAVGGAAAAPSGNAPKPGSGASDDQAPKGKEGSSAEVPSCQEGEVAASYLWFSPCLFPEERLFVIVLFAGALGGLVHSLRSFYWYLGNRELYRSWIGMYVALPIVGSAMAVVFYLVIRGGFTAADASFDQTNPFGFAAMAVLVGMFTEQAALRLKQVAETVLAKPQKGKEHAGAPTVVQVDPKTGSMEGGEEVTLRGDGFRDGVVVRFGGRAATDVRVKDGSTLVAKTPPADEPGSVDVEVLDPGGQKGSLPDGFTYTSPD